MNIIVIVYCIQAKLLFTCISPFSKVFDDNMLEVVFQHVLLISIFLRKTNVISLEFGVP